MKKEALTGVAKSLERTFDDLKRFAARESGLAPDSTRNLMKVNQVLGSARRREEGVAF